MRDALETTETESKRRQVVAGRSFIFLSHFAYVFLFCMHVHTDSSEISSLKKTLCFHGYLLVR